MFLFMMILFGGEQAHDVHSYANTSEVTHNHLDLKLNLNFEKKVIEGEVTLHLKYHQEKVEKLILDSRDLTIHQVTNQDNGQDLPFKLGKSKPFLGEPLSIDLKGQMPAKVSIKYHTDPGAGALQWLDAAQTTSKKLPFLFTQGQAILTRTYIPCMDSPGVRITFDAEVKAPKGINVVMGAKHLQHDKEKGLFRFNMPFSIPPYLISLGAGELEFKAMSKRTGVYAEPAVLEKAAWEFAEAEKMIEVTESLFGPYDWERFDILVLPPSFPFGGMENPMLTFATPTIIAGDRSLVSLLAHELAHSWSGNLVTNATWDDFWLNEGFTTYTESRIMEALTGVDFANMHRSLGQQDLKASVERMVKEDPKDTHLKLNLKGRDPDEGMSDIAYEKGANFLMALEHHVGRDKFDSFLKDYFRSNAFQTITTEAFLKQLKSKLFQGDEKAYKAAKVEEWVYGPGLPDNMVNHQNNLAKPTRTALEQFASGTAAKDLETKGWITQQWLDFIRNLPEGITAEQMGELDGAFSFSKTGNSEILFAWVIRSIEADYQEVYPAMEHFLKSMGRRKFLAPIYATLMKFERTQEMAKRIYKESRDGYHPISVGSLDPILEYK